MDALKTHEHYRPGGLFDEFVQLEPAQLSWGGVVSVIGNLIQSHGACLARLTEVEAAVGEMRGAMETQIRRGVSPVQSQPDTVAADVDRLYSVMQIDKQTLDSTLHQAEAEGSNSHAKVKLLHSLPAFSTLIEDIRDVLVPLSSGVGSAADRVPPPSHQSDSASYGAPPPVQAPQVVHSVRAPVDLSMPPSGGRPMAGLEIIDSIPGSSDPLSSSGVRVFAVRPDGPAAMAGVRNGDCIIALNDKDVQTRADLKAVMANCRPNDLVKVELLRENVSEAFEVHLRLGTAPSTPGRS